MQMEGEVAAMKKIGTTALCILLALSFVVCVICYGENKRFSLEKYLTNLSQIQKPSSWDTLIFTWEEDYYYQKITDPNDPNYEEVVEVYWDAYTGDQPILAGISNIVGFFKRLRFSALLIVGIIGEIFEMRDLILPWNATVEVT